MGLNFDANQNKGVYLGKDGTVEESHSFTGLPKRGYTPVQDNSDWMIREYFTETATPNAMPQAATWSQQGEPTGKPPNCFHFARQRRQRCRSGNRGSRGDVRSGHGAQFHLERQRPGLSVPARGQGVLARSANLRPAGEVGSRPQLSRRPQLIQPQFRGIPELAGVRALPTAIDFTTRGTRKPEAGAQAPAVRPELPKAGPNSQVVVEGVGWKSFRVGATRAELIKAYGDPEPNPGNPRVRWLSQHHIDCRFDEDGRAAEVRFNARIRRALDVRRQDRLFREGVLSAYGVPAVLVQQPQASEFSYENRGVDLWVTGGKVSDFTVFKVRDPAIGIGIYVGKKDDRVVVFKVMADWPAESAGLQPGDRLRPAGLPSSMGSNPCTISAGGTR